MSTTTSTESNRDDEPVAAWERQPGETQPQYRAFCRYRDLGPGERSLSRAAKSLGYRSVSHLERWSSQNQWLDCVAAYDDHLDEQQRLEYRNNLLQFERGEFQLIRVLRGGVMRRLVGFDGGDDPTQAVEAIDLNQLTPRDVAAWSREASRMASSRPERRMQRREALAKAASLSEAELVRAVKDLFEIFDSFVPGEAKPLAAEMIRAYLNGDISMRQLRDGRR